MLPLCEQVEQIVHGSEVFAVVREMRRGARPRVGDMLQYTIELPAHVNHHSRPQDRYRFAVEPWHIVEADRMLRETG